MSDKVGRALPGTRRDSLTSRGTDDPSITGDRGIRAGLAGAFSRRGLLRLGAGVAIGTASWLVVAHVADTGGLGDRLGRIDGRWLAAFAVAWTVATALRVVRWAWLFPASVRPQVGRLFDAFGLGAALNCILPGRAGDVGRAMVVGRETRGLGIGGVIGTLVIERMLDGLAVCAFLAVVLLFVPLPSTMVRLGGVLCAIFVGALVLARWIHRRAGSGGLGTPSEPAGVLGASGARVRAVFRGFSAGLAITGSSWRVAGLLVLSIVIWGIEGAVVYGGFLALGMTGLPWLAAVATMVFIAIGTMLPAAPGFVGTYQLVVVAALAPFEVPSGASVAVGIVLNAAMLLFNLCIGAVAALRTATRRIRHGVPAGVSDI